MPEGQAAAPATTAIKPASQPVLLSDYRPPAFLVDQVELVFELDVVRTTVRNTMQLRRNPALQSAAGEPLQLDGENLQLVSLALNGELLAPGRYTVTAAGLTINDLPDTAELVVVTSIDPASNLAAEGLYLSDGMYCTQCEAEGFRRITYYPDRPDVMAVFTTTIVAEQQRYPVLLANGNKVEQGELPDGRHWAKWHDPFKKPCYLFAMVAGDLQCLQDSFTTMSGREIALQIFVEQKDLDKCEHAMRSLKNAMRWDEEVYGREYDLELYMIVAVDFFNMGAMENKGLNIFNTSCVLAHCETQTDAAFQRVEAVVAHEYFHNWSGNRVTCRDWFQLSLKEGFTVFRDASFSADMNSATVKRIEDVSLLRSAQFAEDAGPMAHPVRPDSYIEISNFYTLTIYEKGAEVIRMLHQLLGAENFRRGSDLYFERFDGQAVTCEDFIVAMEQASGMDLDQFRRWYSQAGTPVLEVTEDWDPQSGNYQLCISQHCPATPGQATKLPFFMPVSIALLGAQGILPGTEQVLQLGEQRQVWTFAQLPERPVPSLLRGFSAPVNLHFDYSYADLLRLLTVESDGFARWDASQRYMMKLLTAHIEGSCALNSEQGQQRIAGLADVLAKLLNAGLGGPHGQWHASHDAATLATLLQLPEFSYVIEQFAEIDIEAIDQAVRHLRIALAQALRATLVTVYQRLGEQLASMGKYQPEAGQIALRSLKNTCMQYLALDADGDTLVQIQAQFAQADNMTERASALAALVNCEHKQAAAMAATALQAFYQRYQNESLVVNQWFTVQVAGHKPGALQRLQALLEHPAYDNTNPNKVRALLGAFCSRNLAQFHAEDGAAYALLADEVLRLDSLNPQLAARLLAPMTRWRRFAEPQRGQMQAGLERIAAQGNLSADVFEVVSKTLASAV